MNSNQTAIVQEVMDTCLKAGVNPMPVATKLAVAFEGDTVDPTQVAALEATLLSAGASIAAEYDGLEHRRAQAAGDAAYAYPDFTWQPATNQTLGVRLGVVIQGVQKLYACFQKTDEPAPPSP